MYVYIYMCVCLCAIYTSRWYVRNYVRIYSVSGWGSLEESMFFLTYLDVDASPFWEKSVSLWSCSPSHHLQFTTSHQLSELTRHCSGSQVQFHQFVVTAQVVDATVHVWETQREFFHLGFNRLVSKKNDKKSWILPPNLEGSCIFTLRKHGPGVQKQTVNSPYLELLGFQNVHGGSSEDQAKRTLLVVHVRVRSTAKFSTSPETCVWLSETLSNFQRLLKTWDSAICDGFGFGHVWAS